MAKISKEEQIERIMRGLNCSAEEAESIYADDVKIEHGEKMDFDLTAEQEKASKKMRQADRKPRAYNFKPKERKADSAKDNLIEELQGFLASIDGVENVTVLTAGKLLGFSLGGDNFELDLKRKRKPKT